MKIHDSLPTDDLLEGIGDRTQGRQVKTLAQLRYGIFFLPENIGKTLEVLVTPDKRVKSADFQEPEAKFRSKLTTYVRPKGQMVRTHPELQDFRISIRKSASKENVLYVTVTRRDAQ